MALTWQRARALPATELKTNQDFINEFKEAVRVLSGVDVMHNYVSYLVSITKRTPYTLCRERWASKYTQCIFKLPVDCPPIESFVGIYPSHTVLESINSIGDPMVQYVYSNQECESYKIARVYLNHVLPKIIPSVLNKLCYNTGNIVATRSVINKLIDPTRHGMTKVSGIQILRKPKLLVDERCNNTLLNIRDRMIDNSILNINRYLLIKQ